MTKRIFIIQECHPERSEGSGVEILRPAFGRPQDDRMGYEWVQRIFILGILIFALSASPAWSMARRPAKPAETPSPIQMLTLDDCYALAVKRSETIGIRKEEINKTYAQYLQATGQALGDVDFVVSDTLQDKPSIESSTFPPEKRERKIVITQPIFQGFKALGALAGAGGLHKLREREYERALELLYLDTAKAFYGSLRQAKDVEIIEGVHVLFEERIRDLGERESIGRSRTSEVATAKAKMKIVEAQLAQARGAYKISNHLMQFFTGLDMERAELHDPEMSRMAPKNLGDYLDRVTNRPDVRAAFQGVKVARQAFVVTQSELWPVITLENNQYQKREGLGSDIDWDLLFRIKVPLFRGGGTFGKVKEAWSEVKEAKLSYSLVKRRAELEIKDAYQNWVTSLEQAKALEEAERAAEENYRLQKDEYGRSLVNNLDVLAALETLFNTSRESNQVRYAMRENYWKFQVATSETPLGD